MNTRMESLLVNKPATRIVDEILSEAFTSSIVSMLNGLKNTTSYKRGLVTQLYEKYKLQFDKITDDCFIDHVSKEEAKMYAKANNKIVFFIREEVRGGAPLEVDSRGNDTTSDSDVPCLIALMSEGGEVTWGRKSWRSGGERNIGKAHEYDPAFNANLKNFLLVSDRIVVLDLAKAQAEFTAEPVRKERFDAKKGAEALMDAKFIKAENLARYKTILADKFNDVESVVKEMEARIAKVNEIYTKILGMKFVAYNIADSAENVFQQMKYLVRIYSKITENLARAENAEELSKTYFNDEPESPEREAKIKRYAERETQRGKELAFDNVKTLRSELQDFDRKIAQFEEAVANPKDSWS